MNMENNLCEMYSIVRLMGRNAAYKERIQFLKMLDDMAWFDNFGYEAYQARIETAALIAREVPDDDIPKTLREDIPAHELQA